jgi:tRNA1Val (adenine37-N6)-methyltransferase
MPNSWFQFQQFRINQDQCAMKISTDAVLMGGLAFCENPLKVLDVGTGTGVIALMLAQRFPKAEVSAIELDELTAIQAKNNFLESPFTDKLTLWNESFQAFKPNHKFDLIVSNPPYFPDHLKSKDEQRNRALHADELPFRDLISKVSKLLNANGNFWVILPPRQMLEIVRISDEFALFLNKKYTIQDKPGKRVLREIVCFSFQKEEVIEEQIFIKNEDGSPHLTYRNIVNGFLLEFS